MQRPSKEDAMKKKGVEIKMREVEIKGKKFKRAAFQPTRYPGVLVTKSATHSPNGEPIETYYLQYRLVGKSIFEKAMVRATPGDDNVWIHVKTARDASGLRADKIKGKE